MDSALKVGARSADTICMDFYEPSQITPYSGDVPRIRRSLDQAIEVVHDALRSAHGSYRRAWESYAGDDIVSVLDLNQRQVESQAKRLLGELAEQSAKLDEAQKVEASSKESFLLTHRIESDLRTLKREVEYIQETATVATRVAALGYKLDDEDDENDQLWEITCEIRDDVSGAHIKLRAARIGDEYHLLSTGNSDVVCTRSVRFELTAPTKEEAAKIVSDAADRAGVSLKVVGVEEY